MRCISLTIALALTAAAGRAHATPFEPSVVPQDVGAVGHLDVDALYKTQLYVQAGGAAALDKALDEAPEHIRPIARQLAKTARGVTFWHDADTGAVYVETRDGKALASVLPKLPVKANGTVEGVATYRGDKDDHNGFLAAYGDTLVMSNTPAGLARSLKVLAGHAPSLAGSSKLPAASRSGMFVFVTVGSDLLDTIGKHASSKMMQLGIKQLVVDVAESGGAVVANVRAEMGGPDQLAKAKSILEGARAMASLSDDPDAKTLIDSVTVSSSGNTLVIVGKVPVAELLKMHDHPHHHP